jgi:long-chain acyl-CoA synthetase
MESSPTLVDAFERQVAVSGPRTALLLRRHGQSSERTWNQLADLVHRVAASLLRHGVLPGDRVAQLAENRLEWLVCDLALATIGAVHVPMHATLTGEQIVEQLLDCGATTLLLAGALQADKLRPLAEQLPGATRYFSFDPVLEPLAGVEVGTWDDLAAGSARLPRRLPPPEPDQLATIIYTSGTTGEPKGVMLSHGNLQFNASRVLSRFDERPEDVRLSLLPWSHVFARTCDLYTWFSSGVRLAIAGPRESLLADCALWKPTLINGVPLFYERLQRHLIQSGQADQPGAIRQLLGGNVRVCCCGGAALSDALFDYYLEQQVPLLQGYGLTETSPVICLSTPTEYRRGSIGRPLPEVGMRLAEDGEILTHGPHVMQGYWGRPDETRQIVRDGWLHTGDLGRRDDQGFWYVTGRKREILVTSGGKNVAPVRLEALLTQDPLILQAVVVGDGRDYLAALVVPDLEALHVQLRQDGIPLAADASLLEHPHVKRLYSDCIARRMESVAAHETVRRFALLQRGLTAESGELTPKMSLRRPVIESHFRAEIDSLYAKPRGN